MDVGEYARFDGLGLAELIAAGQVSAGEVQQAARAAIEAVNPALDALAAPLLGAPLHYDPAGPFPGVPFLIKDVVLHAAGVEVAMGSRFARGVRFGYDTELMARFRRAGLATLGRTATPEFGFSVTTEPKAGRPVRNPWDPARSTGGSSGGSAALVAARAVPIAHGNDGGGSIRVPAALCGLFGLKPTRARTPVGPDDRDPLLGWGVEFALTRTVRDAAALLDCVQGPGVGDKYAAPAARGRYLDELAAAPGRLRVAVTTAAWTGVPVAEACVRAVDDAAAALAALGHDVEFAAPSVDGEAFLRASRVVWCAFLAHSIGKLSRMLGREPAADELEATVRTCAAEGRRLAALDLFAAEDTCNVISRSIGEFMRGYDVLVTPATATPAWPLGELDADDEHLSADQWVRRMFAHAPFSGLFNITGQPAASIPLALSPGGLPVGVQFVARFGDEATLFRLAHQLEQELPWSDRRPGICAWATPAAGAPASAVAGHP